MTKMTKIEWNLLAEAVMENYLNVGTTVASRSQETLQGSIAEVDYSTDDSDICYLVQWTDERQEWCSREEFYQVADEDTKEMINPSTDLPYSEDRIHEESGWQRYGWSLSKKANYRTSYFTQADKLLYKEQKQDKDNQMLEVQLTCLRKALKRFEKDSSEWDVIVKKGLELKDTLRKNSFDYSKEV